MFLPTNKEITRARVATKSIFLVCGLGISSWAPMVPYAKYRLALNDANLGLLLLLLGAGAILMMPVTGILAHKYGSRKVILVAAIMMAIMLPLLLLISSVALMGLVLFVFGAAVGTVDVAMNTHGVQVQNLNERPIMSSLHGLFSVGGLFGSLGLGFLMELGLNPMAAAVTIAIVIILIVCLKYADLFNVTTEKSAVAKFSSRQDITRGGIVYWLNGSVIFLGLMCFAVFLSEGAMLDWSAIFLRECRGVSDKFSGAGYAAFSIAMATMRLLGDRIISKLNSRIVVIGGAIIAAAGLFLATIASSVPIVLIGFILLGIGAANIVPVFFSEGGRLKNVPSTIAIPAITTMGYAGQLAGPALLGFIAYRFSLPVALGFTAILLLLVSLSYATLKPNK